MTKGTYTVKITEDDGMFFALLVNGDRCVPGIRGKHYATRAAAERGAKMMLAKV